MPLLTLQNACLSYGDAILLDHVDFLLDKKERVALIGRNGTGKSSLLRALAQGKIEGNGVLDDGKVWWQPGLSVAYVEQEPVFSASDSVFSTVASGLGEVSSQLERYHQLTQRLAAHPTANEAAAWLSELSDVQHSMENSGAWAHEHQVERIISRFHLPPHALVNGLSGGQKKRLALARALVSSPDVLLLDEPTNHLDIAAISWLENLLLESSLTLVFITHDRRFLDHLATRVVELDRGHLENFPGNFNAYQTAKEARLHEEAESDARSDKLLKQEEIWIRKGVEARRTRATFRVERLHKLREARAARRLRPSQATMQIDRGEQSGKLVAELQNVCTSFVQNNHGNDLTAPAASKTVVNNFSARLLRGDKIGIIGSNGSGKTTLMRLILGEIRADSGNVRLGTKLTVAYFDQFRNQLDENATLADVISPGSDYVVIGDSKKHVIGYLGDFLFAPQRARSPVSSLSGGEKNRLLLARLFARPANILVLDEPTNDLDIVTLELLESLLQDYTGTVFLVSHDREFLDNVVTQTIVNIAPGQWQENVGGYSEVCHLLADETKTNANANTNTKTAKGDSDEKSNEKEQKKSEKPTETTGKKINNRRSNKLTFQEKRELEAIPARIETLEAEQKRIEEELANPAIFVERHEEAAQLGTRLQQIEEELLYCLERWQTLDDKNQAAENKG